MILFQLVHQVAGSVCMRFQAIFANLGWSLTSFAKRPSMLKSSLGFTAASFMDKNCHNDGHIPKLDYYLESVCCVYEVCLLRNDC